MRKSTIICLAAGMTTACFCPTVASASNWTYQVLATSAAGNPQAIPNLDGATDLPALNARGDVGFTAFHIDNLGAHGGVWQSKEGRLARLVVSSDYFTITSKATIDDAGGIGFGDTDGNGQPITGMYSFIHGTTTFYPLILDGYGWGAIARHNTVIAQTAGALYLVSTTSAAQINAGYCDGAGSVSSNQAGKVAYADCQSQNIYVTDATKSTTKLRVAGATQGVGQTSQATINNRNVIAFTGTAVAGQSGANVNAVYTSDTKGRVSLITYTNNGTCSASGPPNGKGRCTYVSYTTPVISDAGAIAVTINTTRFIDQTATSSAALTLAGTQGPATVFATGMKLDGCTVNGIATGPQALNASGQVAAWLSCSDGSARIALATPPT